jgi:hypothetical protein
VFVLFVTAFIFLVPVSAQTPIFQSLATNSLFLPIVGIDFSGDSGFGSISGIVMDARSDTPIAGAEVCLDVDGTDYCVDTNLSGEYALNNFPVGIRNITAKATSEYEIASKQIKIISDVTIEQNFDMLKALEENQFRVVVTWDDNPNWPCAPYICPNDFNLHMWWTLDNVIYERYDIDHQGNCQDLEAFPNVCYENDEQYGSGPDTLVFKYRNVSSQGIYYIAVLNYYADYQDKNGDPVVPTFFERSPLARVRVFNSTQELPVFDLTIDPSVTVGDGDLWYVFQLEFGNPITQNCLLQFDQVGDLPPQDCYDLKNLQ